MKENLWKFDEALKFVKDKRSCIFPNYGFQKQLRLFEVSLGISTEEQALEDWNKKSLPFSHHYQ